MMADYRFKLFVIGQSFRTMRAIDNLRRFCEERLKGDFDLQIIDVLERPHLAKDDEILATPTLIKHSPPPVKRIVGDLANLSEKALGLNGKDGGDKSGSS